ncbi:MAG: 1-acyl-sn-glycerol-3-phosphate acyltransferase [Clostridia bacterium]|nr:1-acyl-sn-glycerol-3-phosphate acyltransferase [Clostridia bacterium]
MKKTSKMSSFVLGFVKLTGVLPGLLFFKPKVYKQNKKVKRNLPGNAILMSNHTSLMDFVLYLIVFFFRNIHFLMAEVLFKKGKFFSWFLYKIGGIFVDRDACNFSFVEESLNVLDSGGSVGVFPQGRLPVGGKPFPYKPGIVLIALRTDAPIIPVYTDGNYGLFKRAHVIIGEAIYLRDYVKSENVSDDELKNLTKMLEDKSYALKDELEKRLEKKNEKQ